MHKKKKLGFTNKLAIYLVIILTIGLFLGFLLAIYSIRKQYIGSLACWTVVFTPVGTALSIVLGKIVDKSKHQNMSATGQGIVFAKAKANNFRQDQLYNEFITNNINNSNNINNYSLPI